MLTRLPVNLFSRNFPPPQKSGRRWTVAADRLGAALAGLLWLPAAMAAVGAAFHSAALPAGPAGWVSLAAGGVPLGLAWCLLRPVRSNGARTAFSVLAPLSILWCVLASDAGPAIQAWGAVVLSLPVWFLFLVPRRGRRNVVCVENTVWRIGLVTR